MPAAPWTSGIAIVLLGCACGRSEVFFTVVGTTSSGSTSGGSSAGSTTGGSARECDAGPCPTRTGTSGTCCNGQCTDTLSDSQNCGGCGLGCGVTVQTDGFDCCDGRCTDVGWDSMNCGKCGVRCASTETCDLWSCETSFCYDLRDPPGCCGSVICSRSQACCNGEGGTGDYECVAFSHGACPPAQN